MIVFVGADAELALCIVAYCKDIIFVTQEQRMLPSACHHYRFVSLDTLFFVVGGGDVNLETDHLWRRNDRCCTLNATLAIRVLAPCPCISVRVDSSRVAFTS